MSGDGVSATCVRMVLKTDECGEMKFAAGKRQVHVGGRQWKACANKVELVGNRLVLTGKVKVISDKVGACSALRAGRVTLELHGGRIEKVARASNVSLRPATFLLDNGKSNPNARVEQLLIQSEDLRKVRQEWQKAWAPQR
jgi:hypothetical protein